MELGIVVAWSIGIGIFAIQYDRNTKTNSQCAERKEIDNECPRYLFIVALRLSSWHGNFIEVLRKTY
jgi:hypothetical protein